jgi:hypothetical protein
MVNRVRRKLKWEDVSSFSATDDLTNVLIDCVNEAKRDVLENYEWDFDIRSDGIFKTVAARTHTNAVTITNGGTTATVVGGTFFGDYDGGDLRMRIRLTEDPTYGDTAFIVTGSNTSGGNDVYTLETSWPGATASGGSGSAELLVSEYIMPTTVRDVLSVMVEDVNVYVEFVDKAETIDQQLTNPFLTQSTQPEICYVGGSTTPTVLTGNTATPGLGIWLYPVPSSVYLVRYTYRYRHPAMSATTDVLQVPDHVVDHIVNLAEAIAHRTRVAPDLEAAAQIEALANTKLMRSARRSGSQPLERMTLQSHDRRGGGMPAGSPKNPRVFYSG